ASHASPGRHIGPGGFDGALTTSLIVVMSNLRSLRPARVIGSVASSAPPR
ncbi:MAG: hypothetical protein JWR78_3357, partial [Mycobacterium sp.]|nr:hypothetical protein [Mycobacterium sp.]